MTSAGLTRENPPDIGAFQVSVVVNTDITPPISTVNPLPAQTTSTTFNVSVTASDPQGPNGAASSGVASIVIYDSTNGGAFVLFTTVLPSDPDDDNSPAWPAILMLSTVSRPTRPATSSPRPAPLSKRSRS